MDISEETQSSCNLALSTWPDSPLLVPIKSAASDIRAHHDWLGSPAMRSLSHRWRKPMTLGPAKKERASGQVYKTEPFPRWILLRRSLAIMMTSAAFTVSDSGFTSFEDLDTMFHESLEMAQIPFSDEKLSIASDNGTTIATDANEMRLSNVEEVCDATSRQNSVDTSKTPSSPMKPTNPSDFSAVNDQYTVNSHPASSSGSSGLHLCIDQPTNSDGGELVSGATGDAIGDLECTPHEQHSNDCAPNDQVSCRPTLSRNFVPPTLLSCAYKAAS